MPSTAAADARFIKATRAKSALGGIAKTLIFLCVVMPGGAGCLRAQTPAIQPQPHFDVASVKRMPGGQLYVRQVRTINPGYFRFAGVTLEDLIRYAYGIQGYQPVKSGPSWINSENSDDKFVVEARYSPGPGIDSGQIPVMLQALLADRFKLAIHTVQVESAVYELRRGEGPNKLMVHTAGAPVPRTSCPANFAEYNPVHTWTVGPVGKFTDMLAKYYKLDVVDKTGLTGNYVISFCYPYPRGSWPPPALQGPRALSAPPPPPIETAVKDQLGLTLVKTKGKIEEYVVDHAEMPSAN